MASKQQSLTSNLQQAMIQQQNMTQPINQAIVRFTTIFYQSIYYMRALNMKLSHFDFFSTLLLSEN